MRKQKPELHTRSGNRVDYLSSRYSDVMPQSADGDEVLYHEYGTQLRRTFDGLYILNVLCGRVAQYGVKIALTTEEITRYHDNDCGDCFIHNLGEDIYNNPDAFKSRVRRYF